VQDRLDGATPADEVVNGVLVAVLLVVGLVLEKREEKYDDTPLIPKKELVELELEVKLRGDVGAVSVGCDCGDAAGGEVAMTEVGTPVEAEFAGVYLGLGEVAGTPHLARRVTQRV